MNMHSNFDVNETKFRSFKQISWIPIFVNKEYIIKKIDFQHIYFGMNFL